MKANVENIEVETTSKEHKIECIIERSMNLNELFTDTPIDEKQIWAKSGQKVVRKYRCTSGARKGRIVAKPGQCFAAPNIKARFNMKRTRARVGKKMVRLARRS